MIADRDRSPQLRYYHRHKGIKTLSYAERIEALEKTVADLTELVSKLTELVMAGKS